MKPRLAVPLAAAVLAAAVPASAGAATISTDKACYRAGADGVVTGSGYTPGAVVSFTRNGVPFGNATADSGGNFNAGFGVGSPAGQEERQTLVGTDGANAANTGTTVFTVSELDVRVTPQRARPAQRRRIRARGFDQGRSLFAHVRGARRRNVRVGRLRGPCGKLNKRVRIFRSGFPTGVYTVQFDQNRGFSAQSVPRVVYTVTIFRVFRPRAGRAIAATTGEVWTRVR